MSTTGVQCPLCGRTATRFLYEAEDVPVHSVLLMSSRDEALGYPRGDVCLRACGSCGFVFNSAFDPRVHEYSPQYEETQGFSPTFRHFAESLARRWIERYQLRGKTILEIGAGKCEFLALLCALGDNRGIAVDPAIVPERLPPDLADRIEVYRHLYGPRHATLLARADVVVCRHTLEHIAPVSGFLQELAAGASGRDLLILFEVPDTYRVLAEGAFWDVYYEHCSYFTRCSIARLFRRAGFAVVDAEMGHGGQYIVIAARPGPWVAEAPFPADAEEAVVGAAIEAFPARVAETVGYWRQRIARLPPDRRVALWGGGSKAVAFLCALPDAAARIELVVDINPYKHDRYLPATGQRVISPEELLRQPPDLVIAMNPIYLDEIRADLRRLGLTPELTALSPPPALGMDAPRARMV